MVDTDAVEPPTPDFSGLPSMISPVKSPESSKKNQPSHLRFLTIASIIFRAGSTRQYTGNPLFDWFARAPA